MGRENEEIAVAVPLPIFLFACSRCFRPHAQPSVKPSCDRTAQAQSSDNRAEVGCKSLHTQSQGGRHCYYHFQAQGYLPMPEDLPADVWQCIFRFLACTYSCALRELVIEPPISGHLSCRRASTPTGCCRCCCIFDFWSRPDRSALRSTGSSVVAFICNRLIGDPPSKRVSNVFSEVFTSFVHKCGARLPRCSFRCCTYLCGEQCIKGKSGAYNCVTNLHRWPSQVIHAPILNPLRVLTRKIQKSRPGIHQIIQNIVPRS